MKVCFFASDKRRERVLAGAFLEGVRRHGDLPQVRFLGSNIADDCDVACMVGVKSRAIFEAHVAAGVLPIMLDKGYVRHRREESRTWEYWRVAVGAHHPTSYLMKYDFPDDRWQRLELEPQPWRHDGAHIVLAGSSAKYHAFYGLRNPTIYAKRVVKELRRETQRPIIYRPKPSWRDAVPIRGTEFSGSAGSIINVLPGAHALVTHGSNACFEAVLHGIPCVVLGDGVARPISSTSLAEIEQPHLADAETRDRWLANLAYCQWTEEEFASGEAWEVIKVQMEAVR